ncbi:tRNA 2-thiouridine(34) synthase MnmA [Boudabousia liubingyangii]|uniref:tRNA-specific 2-thiouridylase MnmA n=1 Tax=Boudabousia liubingyangii TaxID=1921764 RepID=A0A1Q5PKQ8_9ACTO|nr:tRNA 2-thiouridine(34) synthase MnmA [Boudabousia liubingyangii]OKL46454.1 tRNA 2-thiouridine(34) synthase MnmA [Boudabousia liubingyangii]OKL47223.1 tRNA 2-thiouridine(34) synthase MnmA [Boudabousia liubingyangii]
MKVLAALSGGVDSAVAAARAVAAGHDVTAVHMALSSNQATSRCGSRGCCTLEDSADAARAAAHLGIPFYVWDLADSFHDTVMDDFLAEYSAGRTPNPCVRCNEFVKFRELLERGTALGFDAVCTGHYAKLIEGPKGPELHRADDDLKDQSYVLAVMGQEALSRVLFPLGDAPSKAAVRQEAADRGLTVSNKPDSYDICFIPDGDTYGFLQSHLGRQPGPIVSPEGEVLGEHNGYFGFTVGQRKGLNIGRPAADGRPRYVLETRPETNEVVVGPVELLTVNRIKVEKPVWLTDPEDAIFSAEGDEVLIQVRAHGKPIAAIVKGLEDSMQVEITGCEHGDRVGMRGIAAGQSLVVYRDSRVIAQGTIANAARV